MSGNEVGEDGDSKSIFVRKVVRTAQQTDNEKAVSSTYYNPLVIPHIACWISPDFAILVSDIVNDFLVGEYKKCLEEERSRRSSAERWAKEEKAGREVPSQLQQLTEEQNEVMKRELASADEEVKEKDKALDNKNVEIARKGAELAVAGLNLVNTNARLNTATTT